MNEGQNGMGGQDAADFDSFGNGGGGTAGGNMNGGVNVAANAMESGAVTNGAVPGAIYSPSEETPQATEVFEATQVREAPGEMSAIASTGGADMGVTAPMDNANTNANANVNAAALMKDDIVFSGGTLPRRHSRKRLWVILGVVGAIVVVAGVVFVLWLGGVFGSGVPRGVKGLFREYANYVLYGPEGTALEDGDYYIDTMYGNDEFLKTAQGLFNTAYERLNGDNSGAFAKMELPQTNEYYGFLLAHRYNMMPDVGELYKVFVADGEDAAGKLINKWYVDGFSSENYLVRTLAGYWLEWERALIDRWLVYRENGCILNGAIVDACVDKLPYSKTAEVSKHISEADEDARSLVFDIIGNIKRQCDQILLVVNGGGNG